MRRRWERGKRKTNEGREVGQVGLKPGEDGAVEGGGTGGQLRRVTRGREGGHGKKGVARCLCGT